MKTQTRSAVIAALHPARLQPYLDASGQNERRALSLYLWNSEMTAAIQQVLAHTEVVLRNAMDRELLEWNRSQPGGAASWLLQPPEAPLRSLTKSKRPDALKRAQKEAGRRPAGHPRHGAPVTHDDVLAQVMFGMWKDLLPNHAPDANPHNADNINRKRMWDEALHKAFHHQLGDPDGVLTYTRVVNIHQLRNRVSHMEPVLSVNFQARMKDIAALVSSIDPAVSQWVTGQSRVSEVSKRRPL